MVQFILHFFPGSNKRNVSVWTLLPFTSYQHFFVFFYSTKFGVKLHDVVILIVDWFIWYKSLILLQPEAITQDQKLSSATLTPSPHSSTASMETIKVYGEISLQVIVLLHNYYVLEGSLPMSFNRCKRWVQEHAELTLLLMPPKKIFTWFKCTISIQALQCR